ALADEREGSAVAGIFATVLEHDEARLLLAPAGDGEERAHPFALDLVAAEDGDGHPVAFGDLAGDLRQVRRRRDVPGLRREAAGQVLRAGHDLALARALLAGSSVLVGPDEEGQRADLDVGRLVLLPGLELAEAPGGEDGAFGGDAGRVPAAPVVAERVRPVERQRERRGADAFGLPDRCADRATEAFGRVLGPSAEAEQDDALRGDLAGSGIEDERLILLRLEIAPAEDARDLAAGAAVDCGRLAHGLGLALEEGEREERRLLLRRPGPLDPDLGHGRSVLQHAVREGSGAVPAP